jgi:hypothetical protein
MQAFVPEACVFQNNTLSCELLHLRPTRPLQVFHVRDHPTRARICGLRRGRGRTNACVEMTNASSPVWTWTIVMGRLKQAIRGVGIGRLRVGLLRVSCFR